MLFNLNPSIADKPNGGYTCRCAYGFYGAQCKLSSYGYEESSFMELLSMNAAQNDIKMTLSTKSMNAMLLFQPGTELQFMALEIIEGSVVFTFNVDGFGRRGITVSKVHYITLIDFIH